MPLGRSTASTNAPLSIICRYLPPYSPDLNPIETLWSKVKALLRKFKARTLDALPNAIQNAFHAVTVSDCSGWFRFCGYALLF